MGELAIIFGFVLIATILTFGFASGMHKRHIAYKERKDAIEREQAGGMNSSEVAQLKERVQVLERLATDSAPNLANEIESLRDGAQTNGVPLNVKSQERA